MGVGFSRFRFLAVVCITVVVGSPLSFAVAIIIATILITIIIIIISTVVILIVVLATIYMLVTRPLAFVTSIIFHCGVALPFILAIVVPSIVVARVIRRRS